MRLICYREERERHSVNFFAIRVPNSDLHPKILGRKKFLVVRAFIRDYPTGSRDRSFEGRPARRSRRKKGSAENSAVTPCSTMEGWHFIIFDIPLRGGWSGIRLEDRENKGPRKFYEARYRFILSFEKTDFVNDVFLAGTR